jgi:methionyl-tRNA formyltransferase
MNNTRSQATVLFFGRYDCDATKKALMHLQSLGCQITYIESKFRDEELPKDIENWHGDFIFCFRSLFILPKSLIDRAKIGAINFHPGPVEYPGSGCLNFALYDNVNEYGVTAHIMSEKVDSGPILECRRFPVFPIDSVDTLLTKTHNELISLFLDLVSDLIDGGRDFLTRKLESSKAERWRIKATKMEDLEKLKKVPIDVSRKELERIIRATYTEKYPPYIELFGYRFFLKSPKSIAD